jgi:hypothetical protein
MTGLPVSLSYNAGETYAGPAGILPAKVAGSPVPLFPVAGATSAGPQGLSRRRRQGEKNRKILFIGTPGSGKTNLATLLSRDTGLPFVSIDGCRIRHSDGTIVGEAHAWEKFLAECRRPAPGILEFSGMGPHAEEVRENLLFPQFPVTMIWLVLPPDTCISRARNRKKPVPYPFLWAPLEYSVPLIHDEIEFYWEFTWRRESQFHAMRQEFSGSAPVDEMYSAVREICLHP